jgi:hypothetical protein
VARVNALLYGTLIGFAVTVLIPMTAAAQATTDVTFKEQVRVPGAVLAAGVYHFALSRDRKTVVISDSNNRTVTTVRVVEVSRDKNGPRLTMRPSVAGSPPEVAALYSTGSTRGVEFIYTREKQ